MIVSISDMLKRIHGSNNPSLWLFIILFTRGGRALFSWSAALAEHLLARGGDRPTARASAFVSRYRYRYGANSSYRYSYRQVQEPGPGARRGCLTPYALSCSTERRRGAEEDAGAQRTCVAASRSP